MNQTVSCTANPHPHVLVFQFFVMLGFGHASCSLTSGTRGDSVDGELLKVFFLCCPLLVSNDVEASKLRRVTPGRPLHSIFDIVSINFPVRKGFQVVVRSFIGIIRELLNSLTWSIFSSLSGVKCQNILAARKRDFWVLEAEFQPLKS